MLKNKSHTMSIWLYYLCAVTSVSPDPHHSQFVWLPEITAQNKKSSLNQAHTQKHYEQHYLLFISVMYNPLEKEENEKDVKLGRKRMQWFQNNLSDCKLYKDSRK